MGIKNKETIVKTKQVTQNKVWEWASDDGIPAHQCIVIAKDAGAAITALNKTMIYPVSMAEWNLWWRLKKIDESIDAYIDLEVATVYEIRDGLWYKRNNKKEITK